NRPGARPPSSPFFVPSRVLQARPTLSRPHTEGHMTPVLQSCFIGLLAMVIASMMACRSENIPVSALAPEFSVRGQPSLPIFSADVDVSISAITLAEAPGSPPAQRLTYHIERSRNARGEWRTPYTDVVLPA